ncbi:MAG: CsbD family protein [Candidatus Moeniiplasma glomeromycotorum]|nr:CsbD family protein [Candidatus Moeniiplasma glomeromycotorum]MCE8162486.1 CsbD family protein [Candidatus Moeniiplasma glomeromycotorum]MCE8166413.1 CsbD family protein [Candidatus Moeniiplasma glomeromycotorum]MCE8166898.1 CsbD family protein [Candidatus Moeniiplasma glomeromycotorum]
MGVGGAVTEGIGKMTGDEGTKAAGKTLEGSATKQLEDAGKGIEKVGKGIKKIFE